MEPIAQERVADTAADEAFLLPASGFFADAEVGVGHVQLPDEFYGLDPARQLAILNGWRKGVEASFRRSLVHTFRRQYGDDDSTPLPERLERFRRDFAVIGVEIPADFALALQRY